MSKKLLCTLLVAALTVSTFVSCGSSGSSSSSSSKSESSSSSASSEEEAEESSEEAASAAYTPDFDEDPYTVHFQYWVAQDASGQQAVTDAVNEITTKELNMNVDLLPVTIGAYYSTISMTLASNEALDLFLAGSANFGTYIESQYIRNWADYLDYLPDVLETLGEDAVKAGYVGDFLVGFSQMKERGYQAGLIVRADIMDELGIDPDSIEITTEDYSTYDQFTELFAQVKDAHPEMTIVGGTNSLGHLYGDFADNLGSAYGVLEDFGQTTTVVNWFETDQCKTFVNLSRNWFQNGYYSADAATNQDSGETLMKAGNLFSYFTNIKPNTNVEKKAQTGYDVYVIPASETTFTSSMSINSIVYCLANASEDPVKAAAFYNWAYTSEEFNDLINWGVEGVDWVENDEGLATYPDGIDAVSVSYHNDYGWAYLNQFCAHAWEGNPSDIWEQYEEFNNNLLKSKALGFNFDSTVVVDEVAQCSSVWDQYNKDIFFGTVDPEQGLADFNSALYAAGLQDIIDAKQEQLDAWLAEQ